MPDPLRLRSPAARPDDRGKMSLLEHLEELRRRLLICLIAVALTTLIALIFTEPLMEVLLRLAGPDVRIQAIEVPERFTTSLRLALIVGVALAMPVLVYQAWLFLRPALFPHEKRYILIGLPLVIFFFVGGILFSYFLALPAALRFLLNFGSGLVTTQPQLGPYLSFISTLLLWSGISFELPIFLFFLAKIHVLDARRLARWRKYAFLIICIAAAIITPTPDPVNMMIVAVPLYLLYEVGIILARLA